jgi:EAL domain-containing protein (putative c-di-GMP-specific phosphodiesterase class I)
MVSSLNILFQPIVDSAKHRILAHHCDLRETALDLVPAAIRSAAGQWADGLYFISSGFPESGFKSILDTVRESDFEAANIVFEISEGGPDGNLKTLREKSEQCRAHGFGLALTDAGTGPESLLALAELRPDFIKLDKVLVRDIERPKNAANIQKLAGFAEKLGVRVVADGVERHRTIENLWLLGIQIMQGSLFGRPASFIVHSNSADLISLAEALEPSRDEVLVYSRVT